MGEGRRNVQWRWLQGEIGDLLSASSWKERVGGGAAASASCLESLRSCLKRQAQLERGPSRNEGGLTSGQGKQCVCSCVCARLGTTLSDGTDEPLPGSCLISNERACRNQGVTVPEGRRHVTCSCSCGTVDRGSMWEKKGGRKHGDAGEREWDVHVCACFVHSAPWLRVHLLWDCGRDKQALYNTWLSAWLLVHYFLSFQGI